MDSTSVDLGSLKPPEPANPPQADSKMPSQDSRRKNPRNKRNSKKIEDLEIQESSLWLEERWIPESKWHTTRQDDAGEWNWNGCQDPPQTKHGCQTWLKQKLLNRQLDKELKRVEADHRLLWDSQVKFRQLSEWTNQAQAASSRSLQMREYAVATHECYWQMMSHQQSPTKQQRFSKKQNFVKLKVRIKEEHAEEKRRTQESYGNLYEKPRWAPATWTGQVPASAWSAIPKPRTIAFPIGGKLRPENLAKKQGAATLPGASPKSMPKKRPRSPSSYSSSSSTARCQQIRGARPKCRAKNSLEG